MLCNRQGLSTFSAEWGDGRCRVYLSVLVTPDGILAYGYGGERAHVGGLAIMGEDCGKDAMLFARPTHKDHVLAQKIADIISRGTGQTTFAVGGFHVDGITVDEITEVLENACQAARDIVQQLSEKGL